VSGGIGYGCVVAALLADLVKRGEEGIGADEEVLIFFGATLEAANENGGGEAGIVKDATTNEHGNFARGGGIGEFTRGEAAGFRELALVVPAAEAVEFVAADFHVHVGHGDEVGKSCDFILCGEDDIGGADGVGETKLFEFGETLGKGELFVAVDAWIGDGFVESDSGRPLGDRIFAFAAFVKTDVDGMHFVEQVGSALDEEVGKTGGCASVDEGSAMLSFEFAVIAELLDFKRVAGEVGTEVEVAGAKAERRAQNHLIKDRSGSVDDKVAAASRPDDAEEIAGVDFGDRNRRFFAEKAASASGVAITTPDVMTLAFEKLGQEGAGRTRSENEDSHVWEECITGRWGPLRWRQSVIGNQ